MAIRSTRRVVRLLILVAALTVLLGATPAFAHDYIYWHAGPQTKIYTSTLPGPYFVGKASAPGTKILSLTAAKAEFEGRQIVIRPTNGAVRDIWLEPSNLVRDGGTATIGAQNVEVFKVDYVKITVPSKGYTRKGQYEPDPLIPMTLANGQRLGWKPSGAPDPLFRNVGSLVTQPYYVLFHVPADAAPGIYHGTIRITSTGSSDGVSLPVVVIPVQLEVFPFSIAKRTLKTSFGLSLNYAMYANSADHKWLSKGSGQNRITETTDVKGDQIGGWLKYFSDHRISPQTMLPAWTGSDSGTMSARDPYLSDYLGAGTATTFSGSKYDFSTAMMPEPFLRPSYLSNPFANSTNLKKSTAYYKSMRSELSPWLSKAFVYPVDEPTSSSRAFVERYAAFVHTVAPGVKFLLTTDPITMQYRPLKGVDIYVQRLQFYYRDNVKWIQPLRAQGASRSGSTRTPVRSRQKRRTISSMVRSPMCGPTAGSLTTPMRAGCSTSTSRRGVSRRVRARIATRTRTRSRTAPVTTPTAMGRSSIPATTRARVSSSRARHPSAAFGWRRCGMGWRTSST